ncbi:hypothetical protein PoB_006467800 [Plakobranchus ocellatus]|uniref:Uncharacterized protein n=1 Tax=Plakobranchus ocellatus TaxID=259542 RepID=A0AAV4D1X7_9GAST|nr:hypothetical protein PoB_006467800 [Plakobranchus ocellatus]
MQRCWERGTDSRTLRKVNKVWTMGQWLPSHVVIIDSEMADMLVNEGNFQPQPRKSSTLVVVRAVFEWQNHGTLELWNTTQGRKSVAHIWFSATACRLCGKVDESIPHVCLITEKWPLDVPQNALFTPEQNSVGRMIEVPYLRQQALLRTVLRRSMQEAQVEIQQLLSNSKRGF